MIAFRLMEEKDVEAVSRIEKETFSMPRLSGRLFEYDKE